MIIDLTSDIENIEGKTECRIANATIANHTNGIDRKSGIDSANYLRLRSIEAIINHITMIAMNNVANGLNVMHISVNHHIRMIATSHLWAMVRLRRLRNVMRTNLRTCLRMSLRMSLRCWCVMRWATDTYSARIAMTCTILSVDIDIC